MEITPGLLLAAAVGVLAVFLVGVPVAAARSDIVIPLVSHCGPALNSTSGLDRASDGMLCATGILAFLAIPGMIGIFWMVFKANL